MSENEVIQSILQQYQCHFHDITATLLLVGLVYDDENLVFYISFNIIQSYQDERVLMKSSVQ